MIIKIITIHNIVNFGSVFQTYALCSFLKASGFNDVEVVDYNPPYFKPKSIRNFLGILLNFRSYYFRKQKFSNFIYNNIPLTSRSYSSLKDLQKEQFNADIFIAGGDQLWNVYYDCGKDDSYKLTFFGGKKISYGTSLGQDKISISDLEYLASKISSFSAVGVRETSSVSVLNKVGIHAVATVDPVFLLSENHYKQFLKPVKEDPYLFVYLVSPSELLERVIRFLKQKYNLKVILCSGFSSKCTCDAIVKDLGPDEILSYIANANIVLSSSFHATSFSMIFKKQFFTILPDIHTNERILDILSVRGLTDRIVTENTFLTESLYREIDYSNVYDYTQNINLSKEFLLNSLRDEIF